MKLKADFKLELNERTLYRMIDRGKRRSLMRAGAKSRGIMRRLIKRRKKKKSAPGDPPFAHTSGSEFGIKTIIYAFDDNTYSVIVGPIGRNRGALSVPNVLEFGGTTRIRTRDRKGRRVTKVVRVKRRPYSSTAFDIYKDEYPNEYKDLL